MKTRIGVLAFVLFALSAAAQIASPALKLPAYKKLKLKNGMTVFLMEKHQVPMVSFSFVVRAGSVADPAGKEGTASLTASLLRKGTPRRTADQISEEVDFLGGQLGAGAALDFTSGRAEFMKKDVAQGMDILADVLMNPVFPEAEVTKLIRQQADGIKAAKDRAQQVVGLYFAHYLYGAHPYGRPTEGDENSLKAITRADIAQFHKTCYTPGNTILAVVGDFDPAAMEKLVNEKFGAWTARTSTAAPLAQPTVFKGKKLLLVDKPDATQTYYMVGNLGIARDNPDRVYLEVVNTLFGGRFTSMINSELRIKSGLTYGAGSRFEQRKVPGLFAISTYTANKNTEKALDLTLEVMKRLQEKGITEEELQSAKAYLKGQYPPRIETSDALANLLTQLEFYGLDEKEVNEYYARIDSLDMPTVKRIIKQYFLGDDLVFVLVGKASEIEPMLKKYASQMDKKAITEVGF